MKKKHHFVPRFYLRKFANLEPEEQLWTYDMEKGLARCSPVDNTGFEKYLYSAKLLDGRRLDDLEDFIANVEARRHLSLINFLWMQILSAKSELIWRVSLL